VCSGNLFIDGRFTHSITHPQTDRKDARGLHASLSCARKSPDWTKQTTAKNVTRGLRLDDRAHLILALPEHYQDRNSWKRATELLMQAAEQDGDIEAATEQFERALFLEARYVRR
jgi:hypothetical protein